MDLQDFKAQLLYFDLAIPEAIDQLLQQAANTYADGQAEQYLLEAYNMAPNDLSVLVGLYRFYYYQHRLSDALEIAFQAMRSVAPAIYFPHHWQDLGMHHLAEGLMKSFTMVRFYLMALKGAAYLNLRMGKMDEGVAMLNKVVAFDSNDRLGAKSLLQSIGPQAVTNVAAFNG